MLFVASMGETGWSHDIFLKFSLRPYEVIVVEWWSMLNFEAATFAIVPESSASDLKKVN